MDWYYIVTGVFLLSLSLGCIMGWKAFVLTAMCAIGLALIIKGLSS